MFLAHTYDREKQPISQEIFLANHFLKFKITNEDNIKFNIKGGMETPYNIEKYK